MVRKIASVKKKERVPQKRARAKPKVQVVRELDPHPHSFILESRKERERKGVYAKIDHLQHELHVLNDYNKPFEQKVHDINLNHKKENFYDEMIFNRPGEQENKLFTTASLFVSLIVAVGAIFYFWFSENLPSPTGASVNGAAQGATLIPFVVNLIIIGLLLFSLLMVIFELRRRK